jgi:hypothetical protein
MLKKERCKRVLKESKMLTGAFAYLVLDVALLKDIYQMLADVGKAIDEIVMCQHFYGHKIKLLLATNQRKPANDLLWHSDRGSQYASESHRALLTANGITQSMSRKGNCFKLLLATFRNQQVTCNHSLNDVVYGYKKPRYIQRFLAVLLRGLQSHNDAPALS